jgi:hypothetical protein
MAAAITLAMTLASGKFARLVLCVCGTLPLAAQGGPPLRTDDPGTPGNRNWEINVASTQFWSKSEREFESPLLDINYGLGDRIQLKYEVPYLFDSDGGAPFKGSIGTSLLGVKWRFYEQSNEKGWRISTYPQLALNSSDPDAPTARFLLPVEVTKIFGQVAVNFEGGYWFAEQTSNRPTPGERILGLAVGHQFNRRFEGLCEVYDDVLMGGDFRSTTFDVGGRYEFRKGLLLLFMAGHSLGRIGGQDAAWIGYLGLQIQITHGPKKHRGLRGQTGNP